MAHPPTHVSLQEFAADVASFFARIVEEQETVVVENEAGAQIIMQPIPAPENVSPALRPHTQADYEAIFSSFGGWSDIDDEAFVQQIYADRNRPSRPPVEL